jgi:TonB family protein
MRKRSVVKSRPELFQPLDHTGSRRSAFSTSAGFHIVLFVVLILLPMIFTDTLKVKYDVVILAPPPERKVFEVTHWKQPAPKPVERPPEKLVAPRPPTPLVTEIRPPEPPKVAEVKPPEVIERNRERTLPLRTSSIVPNNPDIAKPSRPEVKTNVFSTASSAKPTGNVAPHQVQTGGFGDPNGIRGVGQPDKPANIASLGSFDLPVGPGVGNGTGGAQGVRGTVKSAGFGSGVAKTENEVEEGSRRSVVQQGTFGDAQPAQPVIEKKREHAAPQTPAEILYKPKPDFTDEARRLKLEGEVLVRVVFTATGEVRVLDVVRGLGHGLDENAVRAAQQIRFKPAQRNGQAVDSAATVRIVFQLAY